MSTQNKPRTRRFNAKWIAAIVLLLLIPVTYLAYQPGIDGPFLLDDQVGIKNLSLDGLSTPEMMVKLLRTQRLGGLSRSVTNLSLGLTRYTSGYSPRAFKQQNLLLHIANGLLIFWLVALLSAQAAQHRFPSSSDYFTALAVTAVWLLHPLHVSTVLYAVQRLVLMSAFFSLLALCLYVEGRRLYPSRRIVGALTMVVGLIVFWPLAVLSKENAVLIVLVLPLLEYFIFANQNRSTDNRRTGIYFLVIFSAVPITLGLAYFAVNAEHLLHGYIGRPFDLWQRLFTETHAIWYYLKLILAPIPAQMSLYQDGFPIQNVIDISTVIAALAMLALVAIAFALRRVAPLAGLGILWFFAWHALESTILPLELVFEHRNYLALGGIALTLAAIIRMLIVNRSREHVVAFGVAALVTLLGLNTAARAVVWSDSELLTRVSYQSHPDSPRLTANMISVSIRNGDVGDALRYLEKFKELANYTAHPYFIDIWLHCGDPLLPKNLFATAMDRASNGIITPGTINSLRSLAERFHRSECTSINANQLISLAEAVAKNPRVHTESSRFAAYGEYAVILIREGHSEQAKDAISKALQIAAGLSPSTFKNAVDGVIFVASQLNSKEAGISFAQDALADYAQMLARKEIEVRLEIPTVSKPKR